MFRFIKKIFTGLLTGLVNGSNHAKCVLLRNQKCMTQYTLSDLHSNECSQEFHYYPFAVKLDRYVGGCNTFNDLSNKVCVPNKTENLNLNMFNMITRTNESKTLRKHISCAYKCGFNEKNAIHINGGITINVDVNIKNVMYVKKIIFGILLHAVVKIKNI